MSIARPAFEVPSTSSGATGLIAERHRLGRRHTAERGAGSEAPPRRRTRAVADVLTVVAGERMRPAGEGRRPRRTARDRSPRPQGRSRLLIYTHTADRRIRHVRLFSDEEDARTTPPSICARRAPAPRAPYPRAPPEGRAGQGGARSKWAGITDWRGVRLFSFDVDGTLGISKPSRASFPSALVRAGYRASLCWWEASDQPMQLQTTMWELHLEVCPRLHMLRAPALRP